MVGVQQLKGLYQSVCMPLGNIWGPLIFAYQLWRNRFKQRQGVTSFHKPSMPPVFDHLQYCKQSKTGGVEGLGTRLARVRWTWTLIVDPPRTQAHAHFRVPRVLLFCTCRLMFPETFLWHHAPLSTLYNVVWTRLAHLSRCNHECSPIRWQNKKAPRH